MKKIYLFMIGVVLFTCLVNTGLGQTTRLYESSINEIGPSITESNDGGYTIGGSYYPEGGIYKPYILKVDRHGTYQWAKLYSQYLYAYINNIKNEGKFYWITGGINFSPSVHCGSPGDFCYGGEDVWIAKVGFDGQIIEEKAFGGTDREQGLSIALTGDGGCIVTGRTASPFFNGVANHGNEDIFIMRLDESMNVKWTKLIGGANEDYPRTIIKSSSDTYFITGTTSSNDQSIHGQHGNDDAFVAKFTGTGNLLWVKVYGGSSIDHGEDIVMTPDSNLMVAGSTWSNDGDLTNTGTRGNLDNWFFKINSNGQLLWEKVEGTNTTDEDQRIVEVPDGSYFISSNVKTGGGWFDFDVRIMKMKPTGEITYNKIFHGEDADFANSILFNSLTHEVICAGTTHSKTFDRVPSHGGSDVFLISLNTLPVFVPHVPNP